MTDMPIGFGIGSTVYSATRRWGDEDNGLPLGGVVIAIWNHVDADTGETVAQVRTVTVYRGRIAYHTLNVDDLEPGHSMGLIRRDVLKQLAIQLAKDEVASRDPFKHDAARRAIAHVLADHGDPSVVRAG